MGNHTKTRDPQADLYHSDYRNWIGRVDTWLGTQVGEPDYPAHLAPDLPPLITAFSDALDLWDDLNEDQKGKNEVFSNAAKAISKQLQLLKDVIPTTIDEPPVLGEFGLDRKVPADRDDLYTMAQTCVNQWNEVIGGGVPPEYAPLEADFNTLLTLFSAFETSMNEYYAQLNAAQQAQNAMLDARAACHELERKIFNWYRGRHSDPQDEWWTGTEWGTSTGGGEEPGGELPDWPGPMKKYSVIEVQPGTVQIDYSGVKEATKAVIERRLVGTDEWIFVAEVPMAPEEILPFREMHVPPGMWEYRTTPYRDDEPGMPSIATVEVTE